MDRPPAVRYPPRRGPGGEGDPGPSLPLGRRHGASARSFPKCLLAPQPTLRPFPPLAALARWPRGRPDPAPRPPRGHPARRPGRGPRARPCAVVLGGRLASVPYPTLTRLPSLTHFEKVPPGCISERISECSSAELGGGGGRGCGN